VAIQVKIARIVKTVYGIRSLFPDGYRASAAITSAIEVYAKAMAVSEDLKRWANTWKEAAPKLEEIRRREVAALDTLEVLASLESAFHYAIHSLPPRQTSGMVEMQKYSAKLLRPNAK
jgi:hypothetical protein